MSSGALATFERPTIEPGPGPDRDADAADAASVASSPRGVQGGTPSHSQPAPRTEGASRELESDPVDGKAGFATPEHETRPAEPQASRSDGEGTATGGSGVSEAPPVGHLHGQPRKRSRRRSFFGSLGSAALGGGGEASPPRAGNTLWRKARVRHMTGARLADSLTRMRLNERQKMLLTSALPGEVLGGGQAQDLSRFLLLPFSMALVAIEAALLTAVLYNVACVPAMIAFTGDVPAWLFVTNTLADLVYVLTVLVQFRSALLLQGRLVHRPQELASRYVRYGPFLTDLLSSVPWDVLALVTGLVGRGTQWHGLSWVGLLRMPRLLRVSSLFAGSLANLRSHVRVLVSESAVGIVAIIVLMCGIAHTASCLWNMLALVVIDTGSFRETWFHARDLVDASGFERWTQGIYASIMILTSIGPSAPRVHACACSNTPGSQPPHHHPRIWRHCSAEHGRDVVLHPAQPHRVGRVCRNGWFVGPPHRHRQRQPASLSAADGAHHVVCQVQEPATHTAARDGEVF